MSANTSIVKKYAGVYCATVKQWSQRFSSLGYPSALDVTTGWQAWINGKPYTGDFRTIPLTAHELITITS
ncbi:MAG TPA: hypothetical protein VEU97_05960 [Ktedonobacteraceae bacterium]|nr:hypothetical protein [Ktedonobacteraceae bacterium]